ncbi:MAG: type II toxin-antitoxin system RelE/ParE family toxin [Acidimicrobiales bacterium]|nr:type II toxin-antitoxin system RelE/ParE family toxin [Acidimicrobiales bacterium]HMS88001.1 type II toxin-antitoxin system RelE/ParE family toxin [Acidimicrobiales bacterium]HRA76134.1 type II toxin-antitoxin system RelE/ParE family toxin [Propionicimonas sp.]
MPGSEPESWSVGFTSGADRSLAAVPRRIQPAIIEFVFGPLAGDPRQLGKPLLGELEGLWSARRGDYRVLYELDEAEHRLVVHRVAHRSDAYRPR